MTYRELVTAKLCIDCHAKTFGHVRCNTCHPLHLQAERARKPARGIYACTTCRQKGHNAATCQA